MNNIPIPAAVEDELSEAVVRHLVNIFGSRYQLGDVYRGNGFGYLKRTIGGWNNAANGGTWLIVTDLDRSECPATLLRSWLKVPQHPNLLFRVAVREVESWLLADPSNLAKFLHIPVARISLNPDELADPKRELVSLARKAKGSVRHRLVPRPNSTAQQGPDYNACLSEFVTESWDAMRAAENSPSLHRTLERLRHFQPSL